MVMEITCCKRYFLSVICAHRCSGSTSLKSIYDATIITLWFNARLAFSYHEVITDGSGRPGCIHVWSMSDIGGFLRDVGTRNPVDLCIGLSCFGGSSKLHTLHEAHKLSANRVTRVDPQTLYRNMYT